jgi:hypothetical protein
MSVLFTDSLESWAADVQQFDNQVLNYGPTSTALVGGVEISYPSSSVLSIGNGWATWSGGYAGEVLWPQVESATINLSQTTTPSGLSSAWAFGFEVEPNQFKSESFTITLNGGPTELSPITEQVNGDAGAQFFGFVGTTDITSITITDNSGDTFAFGNFYYEPTIGFDSKGWEGAITTASATAAAKTDGFFSAYLGSSPGYLTAATAGTLINAGLQIVSLYEHGPKGGGDMQAPGYYGYHANNNAPDEAYSHGVNDGIAAYNNAVNVGQSPLSAIYFATEPLLAGGGDAAAGNPTLLADIAQYYEGVAAGMAQAAHRAGSANLNRAISGVSA